MTKVIGIENVLMDVLAHVNDEFLDSRELRKGIMHLVEAPAQKVILDDLSAYELKTELGGSALNAVRALALLGEDVALFGAIGEDAYGQKVEKRFTELGIKNHLMKVPFQTGTCLILVTPDGERTMNTCLGASSHYKKELLPTSTIKNAKIMHVTGYQWSTEWQKEAVYEAAKIAQQNNVLISFDVADPFMVEQYGEEFREFADEYADIVFANSLEAKALYGDPLTCGQRLAQSGAEAIIKMSEKGATLFRGQESIHAPAVATTVEDTTGAGDMFAGGFLYGKLKGFSDEQCLHIANTLASDVISRTGATLSDRVIQHIRSL
jgi:sugar/nucleoside kinase (ribokinase family)